MIDFHMAGFHNTKNSLKTGSLKTFSPPWKFVSDTRDVKNQNQNQPREEETLAPKDFHMLWGLLRPRWSLFKNNTLTALDATAAKKQGHTHTHNVRKADMHTHSCTHPSVFEREWDINPTSARCSDKKWLCVCVHVRRRQSVCRYYVCVCARVVVSVCGEAQ